MNRFDRLGQEIAREQDAWLAKHHVQAQVRERLADGDSLRARSLRHARRTRQVRWATGGAFACAAAAAALFMALRLPQSSGALTVHLVESASDLRVGAYVQAPSEHDAALQFSDGSHIELAQSGRARLLSLRSSGADVSLESGQLRVKVQHRQDSSWHIGAGPFVVHVTGTRFDVGWKPESDSFELTLHEGRVELSGCSFGAGYRVLAGQTVQASCRSDHFAVTSAAGAAAVAGSGAAPGPAPAPTPRAEEVAAAEPVAIPAPAVSHPRTEEHPKKVSVSGPSWQSLARSGRYMQALHAARSLGFEQECRRIGAEELSLLANVARYGQDSARETEALQALRQRFHGSKRASVAAFGLGRLEFDNHAAYAEAAEWFRIYLKEQPRGDLAREASGRLLEAAQRLGDGARSRELAERYLRDYAQGPHAELARGILAGAGSEQR